MSHDASVRRRKPRSIRVTLTWDEAEALLDQENAEPVLRLHARAKLIGPLLARREYTPPRLRLQTPSPGTTSGVAIADDTNRGQ